jgi:hypothetical protein
MRIFGGRSISNFPPLPSARMGEGARRAGEGSLFQQEYSSKSQQISEKSPHPAFGHLLPLLRNGRRGVMESVPFLRRTSSICDSPARKGEGKVYPKARS